MESRAEKQNKTAGALMPLHLARVLRAVLLKRNVEEAGLFKVLLDLGKPSNKEISCHMRVVRKTGIQSYNFAS
jgi:hypothetical protein